jgi:DNA-binding transcriptional MocR family regulator
LPQSGLVIRTVSAARVATLVGDFPRSPAYLGLADQLRILIGDGRIGLGVRLPSERELTEALDVSRTTVTRAYEVLREGGYAESRRGSGTFAQVPGGRRRSHDRSLVPSSEEDVIDLSCAAPSAPAGIAEAYQRAAEQVPAYLSGKGYFPFGLPELQARIAATYDARGLPTQPEQIMVTAGALAASAIVARAFTHAGDRVVVESPTYPNATMGIRNAGARLVPTHVDESGWDLADLRNACRTARPRLAYLIPDFQNPTGHVMSAEERAQVADLLDRARTTAVVDEAHCALALDAEMDAMPPPFATYSSTAISIGSASKSFWGGLRLGWIRANAEQLDPLLEARVSLDLGAPVFEQLVLAELLDDAEAVIAANRARLALQRATLIEALGRDLPSWRFRVPAGGLALWCQLPAPLATAVADEARVAGVVIAPGPLFAVEGGLGRYVRIPWTASPEELRTATGRLAEAWARVSAAPARADRGRTRRVLVA